MVDPPFTDTHVFSSYADLLDACAAIIGEFRHDEHRALFSDNADRVFRLG